MKTHQYLFRMVWLLCLLPVGVSAQFKYYEKGFDYYTAGKYPQAIENFSLYLTKNTRDKALDPEVFYLRALSYYKTNDFASAIPDFEETILRDHANKGNIYWFKAKAHDKLGASDDAIEAYGGALRLLGDQPEVKAKLLYERSQLYARAGKLPEAYADLKEGSLAAPGHADIKRELGKLEKQGVVSRSSNTPDAGASKSTTANTTTTTGASTKNTKPANTTPRTETPGTRKDPAPIKKEPETTPVITKTQPVVPTQPSLADEYKSEKRYALVIGNGAYPKAVGVLKNPVNDATDMAKELEASSFDVTLLTNATYGQIRAALLKFKDKIDAGDKDNTVALFYFAGHGVRHEDENYLVPIDAAVEFEDDIARYCFPTQRMVLGNMERSNARMNIVILDACRNNPFPSVNRSLSGGGLGEMRRARGSFIAYATAPGSVAADGAGRNGLYTQELLRAMRKPGLTIEQVFKEVRANVLKLSGNKQNTWDSSNIIGEFYFKFN